MSERPADGRLLLKVCFQFYILNLPQTEIANRLGISRFQVARLLRTALQDGYVVVKIREPDRWHVELERQLEQQYDLLAAIIVDNDELPDDEIKRRVADAAGQYLLQILDDGHTLGVSLGSTVQNMVDQLPDHMWKSVDAVQLIGGGPRGNESLSPGLLTAQLASRFRTRPYLLHAPAVVGDNSLRDSLLRDPTIASTYAMYSSLTTAILGIGALAHGTTSRLVYGNLIDPSLLQALLADGAVGDVLAYVYREDGTSVSSPLDERTLAISLPDLLRIPRRIGVAAGLMKVPAIRGALRGKFINVLITDSVAATHLVDSDPTENSIPALQHAVVQSPDAS